MARKALSRIIQDDFYCNRLLGESVQQPPLLVIAPIQMIQGESIVKLMLLCYQLGLDSV